MIYFVDVECYNMIYEMDVPKSKIKSMIRILRESGHSVVYERDCNTLYIWDIYNKHCVMVAYGILKTAL